MTKGGAVTFLKSCQIGWTEKKQQVATLRFHGKLYACRDRREGRDHTSGGPLLCCAADEQIRENYQRGDARKGRLA